MPLALTSNGFHISWAIFLEEQFQWVNVVEFHTGHTADETVRHRFILADVHVLDVVELSVGRVLDVEMIFDGFVIVDLKSNVKSLDSFRIYEIIVSELTVSTTVDPEFFRWNRTSWY